MGGDSMPRRPPVEPAPDAPSDRRREALEALRGIRDLPRARTKEETEVWIREVRLMGEASDLHPLEKMARAITKPVPPPSGEDPDPRPDSHDSAATNPLRSEPTPRRPRARADAAARTDRNREALEALRSLRDLPRSRTREETEAWIREVRLRREASTLHMLEKIERAITKPVPPPSGEDLDPRPDSPDSTTTNPVRSEPTPRRPTVRSDAAARTDRNREALEALRSLRDLSRSRRKEETDAWIREVRLTRQASTRHLPAKIERARQKPVAPDSGDSD